VVEIGATDMKIEDLKEVPITSDGTLMAQMSNKWKIGIESLFSKIIFETSSTRLHLLVCNPKSDNPKTQYSKNRIANLLLMDIKKCQFYYVGAKVSKELSASENEFTPVPLARRLTEVSGPAALIKEDKQADGQWLMSDYTLKELKHQIQVGELVVPPPSIFESIMSFMK
jgi:hypothetical protein